MGLRDADGLADALRARTGAEVRFGAGDRHLYATDASAYRQVPIGVVAPRSVDDVVATVETCREHGAPITHRGGGTSLAGQAANVAVVVDWSKHLDRIVDIDAEQRLARVQPGVVLDDLQAAAAPYGLRFGPDPATHNRCTLGGMIGNNACGVHSLTTGRTADNVEALEVLCYDGARLQVGHGEAEGPRFDALRELRRRHAPQIRARYPDIPRRVSGYNLDELLPERGFHVARSLVGTEGTCVTVLEATVRLVPRFEDTALVVLGYASVADAADAVTDLLVSGPSGLEGADRRLLAGLDLPDGDGLLLVEVPASRAREVLADSGRPGLVCATPAEAAAVWRAREVGSAARIPEAPAPGPGWEDAAVPPARLGDYLRDFARLLDEHRLATMLYGHFGDGCVHARITFDHQTAAGAASYRSFVTEAADLVVGYGGSLSGEHGDGQSRAELLARMYGDELVGAFGAFKAVWDPGNKMNPGKVVDPRPLDADLRLLTPLTEPDTFFAYPEDAGSFAAAQRRCAGVGLCRRDDGAGTMCPSYMVTHEERHSTRGRARLLYEMLRPDAQLDGWRDDAVRDALELCLSCKGCKVDCPVSVDMATYKAEFMAHHYARRLRPASHYALGLAGTWVRLGARAPWLANAIARTRLLERLGGIAPEREAPRVNRAPRWRPGPADATVILYADTFSNYMRPTVVAAAVTVLQEAGYRVAVPRHPPCCGRPLYDVGMLRLARRQLRRLVAALDGDGPVVVLEPSCLAVFRDELVGLLPDDPAAKVLSRRAVSLAEALTAAGWRPPAADRLVVVHGHCQQKAVVGLDAERRLLPDATFLDAGCCGLAGGFGYEAGERYEVSVAVGEQRVAPAVRAQHEDAVVIADGFSCRSQLAHLIPGRPVWHLAEVLAAAVADART